MRENEMLVKVGVAQWWATIGGAIFAVSLLLVLLAYSTQQIIPTVPSNYVGTFPFVSSWAFNLGSVATGIGVILLVYSKYKLAVLDVAR